MDEPLIGRADDLADLVSAARAAAAGAGSVVVLSGEAGIGKTSLARALARTVRDEVAVSWGSCLPDGSAPPLWPWRSALGELPAPDGLGADAAAGADRLELLRTLADGLVAASRRAPALHVVEDIHWADVASVLLLRTVAGSALDAPVMIVATLRTGDPLTPTLSAAIDDLRRTARERPLSPLAGRDVAALLRNAGLANDLSVGELVERRTGGNPLLVTELLRAVRADGWGGDLRRALGELVPESVASLVASRLRRLPDRVAEILRLAAVLGSEGDLRTLAAVAAEAPHTTLDLVEQARAAGLLEAAPPGRWRFRHELVRAAIEAGMTAGARADAHCVVLEALATDPATPPSVLARHAIAGLPVIDGERAAALATRAGDAAYAHHAYEEAIEWFEGALAASPSDSAQRWRAEMLVRCAEAHRHLGGIAPARDRFAAVAGLTDDPGLLARAALGYADPGADLGIAYRTEDPTPCELLDAAIAAQPSTAHEVTVLLEARLAAELYFSDDPTRAASLSRSAVEHARRLGTPRALVAAGAVHHDAYVVGQADPTVQLAGSAQLLAWAKDGRDVASLLTAHRARVVDLLSAGDLVGVDREIAAFRRLADPLGVPGYDWWPLLWSAMRAQLEGRHDEAEARAVAAYELGSGPFATLAMSNFSFQLFFLRREQGRLDELLDATRQFAASYPEIPAVRVSLAAALAETGHVDEAAGLLGSICAHELARLRDRNWPASWFQLARTAFLVADRDLASTIATAATRPAERCVQVSLGSVCLGATDLGAAWLALAAGDLDAADRSYRTAEATNAELGARSWLAQARADHARLLVARRDEGDVDRAARLGDLATAAATEIGLHPILGSLATMELGDAPARSPARRATGVFRRLSTTWELEYADRVVHVAHARGLSDVAFLLARPGRAVFALELVSEPGAVAGGAAGAPVFDERARREIAARLRALEDDIAEAEASGDGERVALGRERVQLLAEEVARDVGLGGRSRKLDDPAERARKTVSTRIRRAIDAVGRAHPELGRHLDRSIDTGAWCAYRPAEPTEWTTS